MPMTRCEARAIVIRCARMYQDNLCDKNLLFVYFVGSDVEVVSIFCQRSNFKHLTGIEANCTPIDFFDYCKRGIITEQQIRFKKNGTSVLKLRVLEDIMNIAHKAKFLGDYLNSNIYLELDKVVGNVSCGLGVEKDEEREYYPKSVLNGDMRKQVNNMKPIVAVFEKLSVESRYRLVKMKDTLKEEQKNSINAFVDTL